MAGRYVQNERAVEAVADGGGNDDMALEVVEGSERIGMHGRALEVVAGLPSTLETVLEVV